MTNYEYEIILNKLAKKNFKLAYLTDPFSGRKTLGRYYQEVFLNAPNDRECKELFVNVILTCSNEHWETLSIDELRYFFLRQLSLATNNARAKIRKMFEKEKNEIHSSNVSEAGDAKPTKRSKRSRG